MEDGEERVRHAHGGQKYDGLKALKRAYDPTTAGGRGFQSRRSHSERSAAMMAAAQDQGGRVIDGPQFGRAESPCSRDGSSPAARSLE
jgi:hypothetical protein